MKNVDIIKKNWQRQANVGAVLLITLVCVVFFSRLFYPTLSAFINPEFGRSDITHFNMPVKYLMDQGLSNGKIPLWTDRLDNGYPIYAESQMGFWYALNLLLFELLPFPLAFNLGLIFSFIILGTGMFFLLRFWRCSWFSSLVGAITITFSGFVMGHIKHYNVIESFSLLPWVLLCLFKAIEKKSLSWTAASILLVSQQLLAGFLQISFITGLIAIIWQLIDKHSNREKVRTVLLVIGVFLMGLVISAVQLIPSLELAQLSTRKSGFSLSQALNFSFNPTHLATFINPFFLGKDADGSYRYMTDFFNSIFWENNVYIGLIPLFFVITSLLYIRRNHFIRKGWIVITIGLLLALGKASPLYFVFSALPFSYFSTPARYIIVIIFGAVVCAAFGIDEISKSVGQKKRPLFSALPVLILFIIVADFFRYWFFYHPVVSFKKWLEAPQTAQFIKKTDADVRIINIGSGRQWYNTFIDEGWKNPEKYLFFRNELSPNTNVLWNIAHVNSYVGRAWLRRNSFTDDLLLNNIQADNKTNKIGTAAASLISMAAVDYLIADKEIVGGSFEKVYSATPPATLRGLDPFAVYGNRDKNERARLFFEIKVAVTKEEFATILNDPSFDPKKTVILEKDLKFKPDIDTNAVAEIEASEALSVDIKTTATKPAILVLADSYYPGWNVYVNEKKSKILPANVDQRAVLLPKGVNKVQFKYEPQSFKIGALISGILYPIIVLLIFAPQPFGALITAYSTFRRRRRL